MNWRRERWGSQISAPGCRLLTPQPFRDVRTYRYLIHMTSWTYTDCGSPSDPLQVRKMEMNPDPPQPGTELRVHIKGTVQETIKDGAYVDVAIKAGLITILRKTLNLGEEIRAGRLTSSPQPGLPFTPGDIDLIYTLQLPKEISQGRFTASCRAHTVDDHDLSCLDINVGFDQ